MRVYYYALAPQTNITANSGVAAIDARDASPGHLGSFLHRCSSLPEIPVTSSETDAVCMLMKAPQRRWIALEQQWIAQMFDPEQHTSVLRTLRNKLFVFPTVGASNLIFFPTVGASNELWLLPASEGLSGESEPQAVLRHPILIWSRGDPRPDVLLSERYVGGGVSSEIINARVLLRTCTTNKYYREFRCGGHRCKRHLTRSPRLASCCTSLIL